MLPFANLSADKENEYFSDGLAEEILIALSQVEGLRVAARSSSFSFKGRTVEMAEIASKLRVANILDGSVRRAGNRVRVTVQLVDAGNGFQLWSSATTGRWKTFLRSRTRLRAPLPNSSR